MLTTYNGIYELQFFNEIIRIDLGQKLLSINDSNNLELLPVFNDKIINAYIDGSVYIDCEIETLNEWNNRFLYYSSRNIFSRKVNGEDLYLDFLVYNSDEVFPNGTVNRSLGHNNDVNEYEVHQVISGTVFSLFRLTSGELYFGIFKSGDYFEIPPGAFHCSYILEGPAVVANFYCNTFWGDNIDKKPYFINKNDFTIEKHKDSFLIKSSQTGVLQEFKLDSYQNIMIDGVLPYEELFNKGILHQQYDKISASLFDLFNKV